MTRLLIDYPPAIQETVMDLLFKTAALQIIKVEVLYLSTSLLRAQFGLDVCTSYVCATNRKLKVILFVLFSCLLALQIGGDTQSTEGFVRSLRGAIFVPIPSPLPSHPASLSLPPSHSPSLSSLV